MPPKKRGARRSSTKTANESLEDVSMADVPVASTSTAPTPTLMSSSTLTQATFSLIPGLSSTPSFNIADTTYHKILPSLRDTLPTLLELARAGEGRKLKESVEAWGDEFGWEVEVDLDDIFIEDEVKERELERRKRREEESAKAKERRLRRMEALRMLVEQELMAWILAMAKNSETPPDVHHALDVVVAFRDSSMTELSFLILAIEHIFENSSVSTVSFLFSWLETHTADVTKGFRPFKAPGIFLLRLLNELLRRVSRTRDTEFSSRILLYLSKAFPLNDRSGLNVGGKSNTENTTEFERMELAADKEEGTAERDVEMKAEDEKMTSEKVTKAGESDRDKPATKEEGEDEGEKGAPDIVIVEPPVEPSSEATTPPIRAKAATTPPPPSKAATPSATAKSTTPSTPKPEEDSYTRFWTLQTYFCDTKRLIGRLGTSGDDKENKSYIVSLSTESNIQVVKPLITHVIELFRVANRKDKELRGEEEKEKEKERDKKEKKIGTATSSMTVPAGRKREGEGIGFFAPKFLTSRSLFELQVADVYFRRQILVQILIMVQYLRGLVKAEHDKWESVPVPNKQVMPSLVLEEVDDSFFSVVQKNALREIMDSGPPGEGFAFVETVRVVLAREKNWTAWKAGNCWDYEKELAEKEKEEMDKKAADLKRRLAQRPRPLKLRFGEMVFRQPGVGTSDIKMEEEDTVKKQLYDFKRQLDAIDERTGYRDIPAKLAEIKEKQKKITAEKLEKEKKAAVLTPPKESEKEKEKVAPETAKSNEETINTLKNNITSLNEESKKLEARKREIEDEKSSITWRAFRLASSTYLRLFSSAVKEGTGADLDLLIKAIEAKKKAPSSASVAQGVAAPTEDRRSVTPPVSNQEDKDVEMTSAEKAKSDTEELDLVEIAPPPTDSEMMIKKEPTVGEKRAREEEEEERPNADGETLLKKPKIEADLTNTDEPRKEEPPVIVEVVD
ncbi:hypothetical protein BT69DRAFT_1347136 [Atractiella rhizophila]|nr:hypothetical protein BT69DRAFT_1347136 [Atractiella rhizophila]